MPIFEYIADAEGCEYCTGGFELVQSSAEEPVEVCPRCQASCHRVFSSFAVGGKGKGLLSKKNLDQHGFTQFTRKGKGYYEKTAGKGPPGIAAE